MARRLQGAFGMKSVLTMAVFLTCFSMVFGEIMPYIKDARYNTKTKAIEINLNYGGGCAEHKFQLQIGSCRETYPVQCDAKLIDLTTNDFCEAFIHRKISISIHEAGLDNDYYKGALIEIQGADDSKAFITLRQ